MLNRMSSFSSPTFILTLMIFILILSVPPMPICAANNETDMLTLVSFKSSISDPNDALQSWNKTLHFCQWLGVTCGANKHPERVTALRLNSTGLSGQLPQLLANLSFLHTLQLSENNLTGLIPQDLGRLPRLLYLNLSHNHLNGEVPPSLMQCFSLKYINLNNNELTGEIPRIFHSSSNLSHIDLSRNNLSGTVPPSIANLSSLLVLNVFSNKIEGNIPESIGTLRNLQILNLAENELSGTIPSVIYNLSSMQVLSLHTNHFEGSLLPNMFTAMLNLSFLLLHHNNLSGHFPASLPNATNLAVFDISFNSFSGTVPSGIGTMKNLKNFIVASNQLESNTHGDWELITSLTNCSYLKTLVLAVNLFSGIMPSSIANLSSLLYFDIHYNNIAGSIPTEIGNLENLTVLDLNHNYFSSTIPSSIGRLRKLRLLGLAANRLSGQIPYSIGELTQLNDLYLEQNVLNGSIPASIGNCSSLNTMCLTENELSGSIPKELFDISSFSVNLDLSNNLLTGTLPVEVGRLIHLGDLSVANNRLTGEIPSALAECQSLEYLYMQGNFFQGSIPPTLSNLKGLQQLDLSSNNLIGSIPDSLQNLSVLRLLNLSFNDLDGQVPTDGIFKNMTEFSILGNNKLCSENPELHLDPCKTNSLKRPWYIAAKVLVPALSVAICVVMFVIAIVYWHKLKKMGNKCLHNSLLEDQLVRVSYGELLRGTDEFSACNLIGVGSFGSVYKGIIDNEVVAIKVLNLDQHGASKSFVAECEALRNIRHRNLVQIITSCSSIDYSGNDFKALVLKYMPNGSLDNWLHQSGQQALATRTLTFTQRLSIAIDMASALDYLHRHTISPVVHCDLKPSNVLLDEQMHAHLSDFGLARFLQDRVSETIESDTGSAVIKGTIGYVPPEYGIGGQVSIEGDVYSYGIILLELITGKRPTDNMFKEGLSLRRYVQMTPAEQIIDIVDPNALVSRGSGETEENDENGEFDVDLHRCIIEVFDIGLACSKEDPRERTHIEDVIKNLLATQRILL